MIKKKLTRLEQMGIIALSVVIACFFYVKKVYEPECRKFKAIHKKWVKLSKEVKDLKWEQGSKKAIFSSIQKREEELKEAKSELKKVSVVLAGKDDLPEVLTRISRLAVECNLKIREFSPADNSVRNFDGKPNIKISDRVKRNFHNLIIVGGFLDFREFFKKIGFLPKLVTVEKVMIERENEGESLKIALSLSI